MSSPTATGDTILFLDAALEVERGERIAFVGPNGAGKSTLLRLLMGLEPPEQGCARLGSHNVIPGYFAQNQAEALDLATSVINTVHDVVPDWTPDGGAPTAGAAFRFVRALCSKPWAS